MKNVKAKAPLHIKNFLQILSNIFKIITCSYCKDKKTWDSNPQSLHRQNSIAIHYYLHF